MQNLAPAKRPGIVRAVTVRWAQVREDPERGAGTVLVLGIIAVIAIAGIALATLAGVQQARGRAVAAADLAALAGATALRWGQDPCIAAASAIERNGAVLVACSQHSEGIVEVRSSVSSPASRIGLGPARAVARAGPRPETLDELREATTSTGLSSSVRGLSGLAGSGATVGQQAAQWALSARGIPYSWGGGSVNGPSGGHGSGAGVRGFDCSGLVRWAWYRATNGRVQLSRTTATQVREGRQVDRSAMLPGDLIFFFRGGKVYHVALAIGDGQMVHAPRPGDVVRVQTVASYPNQDYVVRRVG